MYRTVISNVCNKHRHISFVLGLLSACAIYDMSLCSESLCRYLSEPRRGAGDEYNL